MTQCHLKAPDGLANNTVTVGDGSVYHVPSDGLIWANREDIKDLLALGFWPYRPVDEQFDQGTLGGGGGSAIDPGDLTVYFDNQLI